jgi:hypothetical protein
MIRLYVTAEGQTEQRFVSQILAPYLAQFHVFARARCVMTSKNKRAAKTYRGGLLSYQKAKADILTWFKEDTHSECRFTTMFDLYRLPDDFPCYNKAKKETDPYRRVQLLEDALMQDLKESRFIPYIQLYEFESLIFADPQKLEFEYLEHDIQIARLVKMVGNTNPELINDNPETAPSKRIIREIPEYDKLSGGISILDKIGLHAIRSKCRHFNDWLTTLERLSLM